MSQSIEELLRSLRHRRKKEGDESVAKEEEKGESSCFAASRRSCFASCFDASCRSVAGYQVSFHAIASSRDSDY